jgi:predicted ATPase/DNA-binding CsgD family transcriptional regulator/tetratricopeptide (TPR) repeat protein
MRDVASRPEDSSSFIGRSAELSEVRELLRSARAVTLWGAGGIGKSRLALRLLSEVAGDYRDGAWFAELADLRQADAVVPTVASVIGVDEEPGRPLIATLADALRDRQLILVLDNCEHLIDACAALCQRLLASAPGLQILATSREPLRIAAEAAWQAPPLAVPPAVHAGTDRLRGYDAVQLFAERASAIAPGFSLTEASLRRVADICRALDGLPLAIELAAAWVRVLSLDQIAARLNRRMALLTRGERTAPARQQTLRAAFDWSYDLLSPPEQVLLRRLSVLASWSLDMAEYVCADDTLPAADVVDLLTGLADKSLVQVEPEVLGQARYRMLETVREYAADWLALAGEADAMRRRRRDYTLREIEASFAIGMAIVPAPWSARVHVFRRFDQESANIREVFGACLADADAETGMRICVAILPVWIVRGTFAEGAAWLDAFLALESASSVRDSIRGPALASRSQLALASGSAEAERLALQALELCRAAGVQFYAASALNLLTEIALHSGRLEEAAARAKEALAVARSGHDQWNEGYALSTMATVAAQRGNLREAEELAESALAVTRAIEQQWGAARTLIGIGDLARLRSELDRATKCYLEALEILRQVQARPEIARCLAGLGRIALEQSDLTTARWHLAESLRLSYASGSRIGMARGLEVLARLAVLEGDPATAVRLAGAVTTHRREAHLPAIPGARTQRLLDSAAGLGQHAVDRLWAEGAAITPAEAVRMALGDDVHGPASGWQEDNEPDETAALQPAGLHSAGQPAAAAAAGPAGGLTVREREVVALLAAGLSNRAIAAKLFITPATAARHVANILAKLGFSSRSQVASWARSAGDY